MHQYQDLIILFNRCFFEKYNTQLVKGEHEPLYLPADGDRPHHSLIFANGYFASALHECSHWLIAGEERRKLVDFGYWYVPDGRSASEQELFFRAEVKPQALEWILSTAAGYRFRLSSDNLNGLESDTEKFKEAVYQQVKTYCAQPLSERAKELRSALCDYYGTNPILRGEDFTIEMLD
jgi:elongation factor P hydroxylase